MTDSINLPTSSGASIILIIDHKCVWWCNCIILYYTFCFAYSVLCVGLEPQNFHLTQKIWCEKITTEILWLLLQNTRLWVESWITTQHVRVWHLTLQNDANKAPLHRWPSFYFLTHLYLSVAGMVMCHYKSTCRSWSVEKRRTSTPETKSRTLSGRSVPRANPMSTNRSCMR